MELKFSKFSADKPVCWHIDISIIDKKCSILSYCEPTSFTPYNAAKEVPLSEINASAKDFCSTGERDNFYQLFSKDPYREIARVIGITNSRGHYFYMAQDEWSNEKYVFKSIKERVKGHAFKDFYSQAGNTPKRKDSNHIIYVTSDAIEIMDTSGELENLFKSGYAGKISCLERLSGQTITAYYFESKDLVRLLKEQQGKETKLMMKIHSEIDNQLKRRPIQHM